ncbi:MAG: hypothetical protein DMF06_03330 [Verrucomicrobia bacterium]|nr:MAG: hypothetical protein DMF06_03330 [Verrucomicrobiota bacterium]
MTIFHREPIATGGVKEVEHTPRNSFRAHRLVFPAQTGGAADTLLCEAWADAYPLAHAGRLTKVFRFFMFQKDTL